MVEPHIRLSNNASALSVLPSHLSGVDHRSSLSGVTEGKFNEPIGIARAASSALCWLSVILTGTRPWSSNSALRRRQTHFDPPDCAKRRPKLICGEAADA